MKDKFVIYVEDMITNRVMDVIGPFNHYPDKALREIMLKHQNKTDDNLWIGIRILRPYQEYLKSF